VTSLSREHIGKDRHASERVKEQQIALPPAEVDQRVTGIKARHNLFRRIEFEHSANVDSKVGSTGMGKLKREDTAGTRGHITGITLAETHDAWSALREDAPLLKALTGLDAKEPLRDIAIAVAKWAGAAAAALMREEISHGFEGHTAVEVESKPAAKARLGVSVTVAGLGDGGELNPYFISGYISGLRFRFQQAEREN